MTTHMQYQNYMKWPTLCFGNGNCTDFREITIARLVDQIHVPQYTIRPNMKISVCRVTGLKILGR